MSATYWRYWMDEKIRAELEGKSREGRITCAVARKIAEDLGVAYKEVGQAANELKIRINSCDLGCF